MTKRESVLFVVMILVFVGSLVLKAGAGLGH